MYWVIKNSVVLEEGWLLEQGNNCHTMHCLLKALNWGWTVAMSPVASELHEVEMMF